MMKKWKRIIFSLMIGFCGILLLSGCDNQKSVPHKIRVVSSLNFYGETARTVLGQYGDVTSLINNSSVDPHDYTPTIRDAKRVTNANFIIENGLGYDRWMQSLSRDAKKAQSIKVGQQVAHKRIGQNPHIWYRKQTLPKLSFLLAKKFSIKDPKHRHYYYQNARKFVTNLKHLDHQRNVIKRSTIHKSEFVDVTEPVFNYTLTNLGFKVHDPGFSKAVENGTDPSPAEIRHFQNDLKHHRISFMVMNSQASDSIVNNLVHLAHHYHIPVLKVTETMPNQDDYYQWMHSENGQLLKILAGRNPK